MTADTRGRVEPNLQRALPDRLFTEPPVLSKEVEINTCLTARVFARRDHVITDQDMRFSREGLRIPSP